MSYQGPRGYRQPDVYDYPAPDGTAASSGEQFAGVAGYAELTAYRRAGYPGYGDFQAPPPAQPAPDQPASAQPVSAQPAPEYQQQYPYQGPPAAPGPPASPGQPAYRGRHSGPFPSTAAYHHPNAYHPPASAQYRPASPHPRVAPGRRSNVSAAVTRSGPAAATTTYLGPESDEFAAPVINPAPVDAPPASDGSEDPTAYAGWPKPVPVPPDPRDEAPDRAGGGLLAGMVTGLLSAAVAVSGSVLAAMVLRPLKSPVSAVASILRSTTVANFAGQHFGSREHIILLALPWLISAVVAVIIGLIARRHRVAGVAGIIAFFGAAAGFVAATRPDSHAADVVPSLVGGVAGAVALVALASVLLGPASAYRARARRS